MSLKQSIVKIYAGAFSLTSMGFMGLVFFYESILGENVYFYEPNRLLAFVELLTVIFGAIATVKVMRK